MPPCSRARSSRESAKLFAAKGWFVGLADINEKGIDETGAMLPQDMWSKHVMDVRDAQGWDTALKDKTMSEDLHDGTKEQIQELTKTYEGKVNQLAEAKEKDVMEQ